MSLSKEQRARLKNANYLELTPYRIIKEEVQGNEVTLLVPKFTNKFMVKHLVPRLKSPYIKLKLDELGSASWMEIDGTKKVAEISNILLERFGDKIQPVHQRLTGFLTQLFTQRYISFREISVKGENNG